MMATNFSKPLPTWKAKGIEPPQDLRDTGWKVSQRPPASYFDWFFNRTYEALQELQNNAISGNSLGNLSQLTTKEKLTLVGAINEINEILKINQSPHRDAINVTIKDAGGYFTNDDVEAVLQEIGLLLKNMQTKVSKYRSNKDQNNGLFALVEWKTKAGLLVRKAVLSDLDANGNYRKQTITFYAENGTTVIGTDVYALSYDSDGDLISEVLQ